METANPTYSLGQITKYALRLGTIGFGGPVALVGYMHRFLVEQKKWISESEFKEGITLAQLMPGPLGSRSSKLIHPRNYEPQSNSDLVHLEKWSSDFISSAKEAAGWAMLVKHPVNGKLYIIVSDEHAMGVLWMARPIVVIDTYEYAFYIDYQNRKAEYIEKFMSHIDWKEAELRFQ